MKREELVVILVLGALVALAATMRLSGITPVPRDRHTRRPRRPVHSAPPRVEEPQVGSGRLIWPEPRERYMPRDEAARTLLEAAERIFTEGLFDAAIATYRRFIDRYPDLRAAEVAGFRIGQCHTLAERHAEAAAQYEQLLEGHPDSPLRPMALLWSGVSHIHIGKLDKARSRLEEAVASFPTSPYAEGARQRLQALAKQP
jgi:TolA-binding protein